jgi:hypothetical protein
MKLAVVAGMACFSASCTTVYDAQGRPQQVVTPEGAAMGILAAGLVGYALNDDDDHKRHKKHQRYNRGHGYYGGHGYRGGSHHGGYCR